MTPIRFGSSRVATCEITMAAAERVALEVLASGAACCVADGIFNPLETMKVKLQVQQNQYYAGMYDVAARTIAEDGLIHGLWLPGLLATTMRAFTYTGARIGLYPSVKRALVGDSTPLLVHKVASGALTGGVASAVFAPIDLVRTRMQADAGTLSSDGRTLATGLRRGLPPRHASTLGAFADIVRNEGGLSALWRGAHFSVARAAVLSGAQLSSYDTLKSELKRHLGLAEGPPLHVACSLASGLIAQTAVQPVDTLRSRAFASSGGLDLRLRVLFAGGLGGLYRGLYPACCRQAPVMLVQMPIVEQLRRLLGLEAFQ